MACCRAAPAFCDLYQVQSGMQQQVGLCSGEHPFWAPARWWLPRGCAHAWRALLRKGKEMWCSYVAGRSCWWWAPSPVSSPRPLAAGRSGACCLLQCDLVSSCAQAAQQGQEWVLHLPPSCRGAGELLRMHDMRRAGLRLAARPAGAGPSTNRADGDGVHFSQEAHERRSRSCWCVGSAPVPQAVWSVKHTA